MFPEIRNARKKQMRSRSRETIRTRSRSMKTGRILLNESDTESVFGHTMEVDPFVTDYATQSVVIEYRFNGKDRYSTVDFAVARKGREKVLLREIKGGTYWKNPEDVRRYLAIRKSAERQGYHYAIVTNKWIYSEPRHSNVKLLYRHRRIELGTDIIEHIKDNVRRSCGTSLGRLISQTMASREEVLSLIARGELLANIHAPLALDTKVEVE